MQRPQQVNIQENTSEMLVLSGLSDQIHKLLPPPLPFPILVVRPLEMVQNVQKSKVKLWMVLVP